MITNKFNGEAIAAKNVKDAPKKPKAGSEEVNESSAIPKTAADNNNKSTVKAANNKYTGSPEANVKKLEF